MAEPRFVFHASAWFPPDQFGGTEVYILGLLQGLARLGRPGAVLAPRGPADQTPYRHDEVEVIPYPRVADVGLERQQRALSAIFETRPGALYHQHSWTPDCGLQQLEHAAELGLPTVVTLHMPSSLCLRGTMIRFGAEACDGRVQPGRCGACWANSRGAPRLLAEALSRAPLGGVAAALPRQLATAVRAGDLARQRRLDIARMGRGARELVAVCSWLHRALELNDVGVARLTLSRQGVGFPFTGLTPDRRRGAPPWRLLYLGRWDAAKGIDVVVRALARAPELPLTLDIHAIAGGAAEEAYRRSVEELARRDPRISIHAPVPRADLPQLMRGYDAMVIPSTCMETGPLVALEAQACGLYVIGSDLGGVAELVDDPASGLLVKAGDVSAWTHAITQFASAGPPPLVAPRPVRTMDDVAQDMAGVYDRLA